MIITFFPLQSDYETKHCANLPHTTADSVTDVGGKDRNQLCSSDPSSKCAVFTVITKNGPVTCWSSRAVFEHCKRFTVNLFFFVVLS